MVRIISKDVGEVQDKFDKSVCCSPGVEDANEVYIKKELGI
jgi:hypothetical protein